jgi:hypothetical protein
MTPPLQVTDIERYFKVTSLRMEAFQENGNIILRKAASPQFPHL